MKIDPNALRECLQGDCNKILADTFHVFDEEVREGAYKCDIDVDQVLKAPVRKINYGRLTPETTSVMPQTSKYAHSRGFVRGLFAK